MAAYSIWGNMGNAAYAVPMQQLIPASPETQGYTLCWDIVNQALNYAPLSWDLSTGDAVSAGNFGLAVGKTYRINAIQVVGARIGGWQAATGTATRTTFVTSTVTLPQLAERVKALIDDLTTHGLIGA